MSSVFITGNSSGLGHGFTRHYLAQGDSVYGMSRRGCNDLQGDLHDARCDLSDLEGIGGALGNLLQGVQQLDLVILNAGVLGEIKDMQQTDLKEIRRIMDINVWSNKVILDWLLEHNVEIDQMVFISSGAAVNGNRGWGAYALSKASLNMLTALYAHEFPRTHLCALAPGLVDTAMQDYLCNEEAVDEIHFPTIVNLRSARGTENMPGPDEAATKMAAIFPGLKQHPSGSFLDIRTL